MAEIERKHRRLAGCVPIKFKPNDGAGSSPTSTFISTLHALTQPRQETLVLLITSRHKPNTLVFPKGGVKRGETAEQAAQRETWEESGVRGQIISCLTERAGLKATIYEDDSIFTFDPEETEEEKDVGNNLSESSFVEIGEEGDTNDKVVTMEQETVIHQQSNHQITILSHRNSELAREQCRWFILLVNREESDYPERGQRQKYWMTLEEAYALDNISKHARELLKKLEEFLVSSRVNR